LVRNHLAITETAKVGELLQAIDSFSGHPATAAALRPSLRTCFYVPVSFARSAGSRLTLTPRNGGFLGHE